MNLDACCGSRMFYFGDDTKTVYQDNRKLKTITCDGRALNVCPEVIADFRNMPYRDEGFDHVVFDPPHLTRAGEISIMRHKYGVLGEDWKDDLRKGFGECWRVLRNGGTLVFKWNDCHVNVNEMLRILPRKPLCGNRRGKTHWMVFVKGEASKQ